MRNTTMGELIDLACMIALFIGYVACVLFITVGIPFFAVIGLLWTIGWI